MEYNKEKFETILTEEFLHDQEIACQRLDDHLQNSPLSKERRIKEMMKWFKKSLKFGLQKGELVEKCRKERVDKANNKIEKDWCLDFVANINDSIQAGIEYKKKKRSRKKS